MESLDNKPSNTHSDETAPDDVDFDCSDLADTLTVVEGHSHSLEKVFTLQPPHAHQ
jgi:hypothetical protein